MIAHADRARESAHRNARGPRSVRGGELVGPPLTMTRAELRAALGISKTTFYRREAEGYFDALRAPVPGKFSRRKVQEFVDGRRG